MTRAPHRVAGTGSAPAPTDPARPGADLATEWVAGVKNGVLLALAAAVLALPPGHFQRPAGSSATTTAAATPTSARTADFGAAQPPADVRSIADWVATSGDNHRTAFAIVDKRRARTYVFDGSARLRGSSLVLLGSAAGDDSVDGIGARRLADVRPEERTTAAGRFDSEPGHDDTGEEVVWIDYEAALALHRVKVIDPKERRLQRLATASIDDKRITNGCINVPRAFFDTVVQPWLGHSKSGVYVLPESKPLEQVFTAAYAAAWPDNVR